eukprot:5785794-Amphidinium_carterae.1
MGWPTADKIWKVSTKSDGERTVPVITRVEAYKTLSLTSRWKGSNHSKPMPQYLQWLSESFKHLVVQMLESGVSLHLANAAALCEIPP